jgi:hypothetical protein
MSKNLETLRSVVLFASVLLLIIALYRRLLFVMGKRKSMTASADVTVRIVETKEDRKVEISSVKNIRSTVHLCGINSLEGQLVFEGECLAGITSIVLPETTLQKPYCKVTCGKEEFNLYY